ncbi:MAG: hypothetical protein ABIR79_11190 [Candidatus Binatia bacterium]
MLSRRELIGKAAVGAAAALAVGGVVGTAVAATRPLRNPTDGPGDATDATDAPEPHAEAAGISAPAPWELLAPFGAGSEVAHGWKLVDLTPVRDGSTVVTLQNPRGRSHRVHICRNDGSPQGLVYTRRVDLVVMNQGYGDLATEEQFGQAVAKLANAMAANEAKVSDGIFAALQPHTERVQRFTAAQGASADGKLR